MTPLQRLISSLAMAATLARPAIASAVVEPADQDHGRAPQSFLGIAGENLSREEAQNRGTIVEEGILIDSVAPGSPASNVGLARGDVVIGFNGQPVGSVDDLEARLEELPAGTSANLDFVRNRVTASGSVRLAAPPGTLGTAERSLGVTSISVEQARAKARRAKTTLRGPAANLEHGALVTAVRPGSRAARAGLKRGDVVVELNHDDVTNPDELDWLAVPPSEDVTMLAYRGNDRVAIVVPPEI